MRSSLAVLALILGLGAGGQLAFAADEQEQSAASAIKSARKDTLELPGVTACHTCEWRPMRKEMEAAQCAGKIGVFDCGRDTNCDNKCEFVKCAN